VPGYYSCPVVVNRSLGRSYSEAHGDIDSADIDSADIDSASAMESSTNLTCSVLFCKSISL